MSRYPGKQIHTVHPSHVYYTYYTHLLYRRHTVSYPLFILLIVSKERAVRVVMGGGWREKVLRPGGGGRREGHWKLWAWKLHKTHKIQYRIQNTDAAKLNSCTCFFYMALGLNDFDGDKSITQAIGRGLGPENLNIFGPKCQFSGHTPSSGPWNGFSPIKIITSHSIWNNRYINSYSICRAPLHVLVLL